MTTQGNEKAKRRAARILHDNGITSGTVILTDVIDVHDSNGTGQSLTFDWDGNAGLHDRATPGYWIGRSPDQRTYIGP